MRDKLLSMASILTNLLSVQPLSPFTFHRRRHLSSNSAQTSTTTRHEDVNDGLVNKSQTNFIITLASYILSESFTLSSSLRIGHTQYIDNIHLHENRTLVIAQ